MGIIQHDLRHMWIGLGPQQPTDLCKLGKTEQFGDITKVFTNLWNGFIFFYGIYNVFLVPCIVLVSEMLSFTVVTKFNGILICKLHRFVLYEVVSKASRGSLLQQWFIRFLVFFQSNVFRKRVWIECSMYRSSPFRSTWNTGYITGLDMCPVYTEAVHSVALGTRVTLQVWTCAKYLPKQSIP